VQNLVEERRNLVDEKTAQSNRLTGYLKIYFPQMVEWFEKLDLPLVCDVLERWPTLEELQKVPPEELRTFFRQHHCHRELMEGRILAIGRATPAIKDRPVIEAKSTVVKVIVQLMRSLLEGIAELDGKIEEATVVHPDFFIFESLPAAGAVLAPRLLAAFGSQRDRYDSADEVQTYSGIAPVTEKSGKRKWVHFRWACPKFLRQSFHEWAGHSISQSGWARAYYQQQRDRGNDHHAAVRALAFKWLRILFRCWKDRVAYDETKYLAALVKRGSPLSNVVVAAAGTSF
jgi:transposase